MIKYTWMYRLILSDILFLVLLCKTDVMYNTID